VATEGEVTTIPGRLTLPEGGNGPGLVLLAEAERERQAIADLYAAEGYAVLCPEAKIEQIGVADIIAAVAELRRCGECTGKVGVLGFGRSARLAYLAAAEAGVAKTGIDCAVVYDGAGHEAAFDLALPIRCPLAVHLAEHDPQASSAMVARLRTAFAGQPEVAIFVYPGVGRGFAEPTSANYNKPAAQLAHSRSIALLRQAIGPHYDLEALWEKHTLYEFGTRDVTATMRTMVPEPYVNHIPVMTGGVGGQELARFYAHHFIPKCPADFKLTPISRTVGADRLVDEMVVSFTHDVEIDWMLPGVPPTGKYVEVPTVAIVNFRGDKLYHEHIYWDQASVLV